MSTEESAGPGGSGGGGGGGGGGEVSMQPDEARAFAGQVDGLEQGIADAQAALDGLAAEPLAVGSGQDNAAIAGWYRDLVTSDTVPAARTLAGELGELGRVVRESAAAWEHLDADGAGAFGADQGNV
jgi:uncharacterized protein YukE